MSNVIRHRRVGNTIHVLVSPNERGPRGPRGFRGPRGYKGDKGDNARISMKNYKSGVEITITDPEDGSRKATIARPTATVKQTEKGATLTVTDQFTESSAELYNGINVQNLSINDDKHLIVTLSDESTVDAGEMPRCAQEIALTVTLDGTSAVVDLGEEIDPDTVSYILINGLTYTDGYQISGKWLTLDITEEGKIPSGKLEVITNSLGYVVTDKTEPISNEEIIDITEEVI